jgi:hypothetical protein
MLWFWLNIPLAAVFFGAWYGIPMWNVIRHPHWGPEPAAGHGAQFAEPEPVYALDQGRYPVGAMTAGAGVNGGYA